MSNTCKIFCILLLLCSISCFAKAQHFINKSKERIIKLVTRDSKKYKSEISQTDTTLIYNVLGPVKPCKMIFHFHKSGRCDSEAYIFDCEECFTKKFNKLLKEGFVKVSDNQYTSKRAELYTNYQDKPYAYIYSKKK